MQPPKKEYRFRYINQNAKRGKHADNGGHVMNYECSTFCTIKSLFIFLHSMSNLFPCKTHISSNQQKLHATSILKLQNHPIAQHPMLNHLLITH